MKERVTLTLDQEILKKVDATVDQQAVKNRSHAVELLLRKTLRGRVPSTAVILAGGKGNRLKPLTDKRPKPLVEVQGKPIIQYNIDLLKRHGVKNIILAIGHMGDQIKALYGDGKSHGLKITYVEEEEPLGTAGCLRLLKTQLKEPFIMMNGDELKEVDLVKFYEAHNRNEARATIALTTVEDPSSYGVAMLDGNKILRFIEKPKKEDAPSKLINSGLYILEPEVTELVPEGYAMMEHNVFPILAREGKLFGYPFSGQWLPTDTLERLEKAEKSWSGFTK